MLEKKFSTFLTPVGFEPSSGAVGIYVTFTTYGQIVLLEKKFSTFLTPVGFEPTLLRTAMFLLTSPFYRVREPEHSALDRSATES